MKRILATVLFALFAASALAADAAKPQLAVTTMDGKTFDLAKHAGKWVIVNFWATWCSPCLKEMPDINRFVEKHKNVAAIGLAYEEIDPAELKAFLAKHPVSYPVALLDVYAPPKDFDAPRGLPTSYLIAPDGSVAKRFLGPITDLDLEKTIAAHGQAAKS